jgi:hypothetical protein
VYRAACVAAPSRSGNRRAIMSKSKLRAMTVRVEPALMEQIESLARQDRRPVASYIALVIADTVAGRCDRGQPVYMAGAA